MKTSITERKLTSTPTDRAITKNPGNKGKANKAKTTTRRKKTDNIKTMAVATPQTDNPQSYIAAGSANAKPSWNKAVWSAVVNLARQRGTFTTADVHRDLEAAEVKTKDRRAIGNIMTEARNQGIIESEGFVRRNDKYTRAVTVLWRGYCSSAAESTQRQ
jgi:hypothetical protein